MRKLRRWCLSGALAAVLLAGCGRGPFVPASPADFVAAMEPVAGANERAQVVLQDLGRNVSVAIDGSGFRSEGVYTADWVGLSGIDIESVAIYPSLLVVHPDGTADFFAVDDVAEEGPNPGESLTILYHPTGEVNYRTAVPVLTLPLPADFLFP